MIDDRVYDTPYIESWQKKIFISWWEIHFPIISQRHLKRHMNRFIIFHHVKLSSLSRKRKKKKKINPSLYDNENKKYISILQR